MIERLHTTDPAALLLVKALREHVENVMQACRTPGFNLALALDGALAWEAGFGLADVARQLPVTPDTVYHSGSLGKTSTGTAIMILVDRGVIALEEPINRYLPFKVENPLGKREVGVRVRLLDGSSREADERSIRHLNRRVYRSEHCSKTVVVPWSKRCRSGHDEST